MSEIQYRGRRAHAIENRTLRIVMMVEGGHVAEIRDKRTDLNPLWAPLWPTIEPSQWRAESHPEYGRDAESKLLSGILGHSLCLDLFGPPSPEETAAGMTVHGEAPVLPYEIRNGDSTLEAGVELPQARLGFTRRIQLDDDLLHFEETVENLSSYDRPIAWTQHVSLGPPFLEPGITTFRSSSTRWQDLALGSHVTLERFTNQPSSTGFTTHLMDPGRGKAYFLAFSPTHKMLLGYVWRQKDFPWLGTWEENRKRTPPPWNGRTLTRGMEFGVSPFPEPRRKMIERASLFGVPTYRWLAARQKLQVQYQAFFRPAQSLPDRTPETT